MRERASITNAHPTKTASARICVSNSTKTTVARNTFKESLFRSVRTKASTTFLLALCATKLRRFMNILGATVSEACYGRSTLARRVLRDLRVNPHNAGDVHVTAELPRHGVRGEAGPRNFETPAGRLLIAAGEPRRRNGKITREERCERVIGSNVRRRACRSENGDGRGVMEAE